MRAPSSPAAKRALALYDDAPRGDRFHVRARWWSCPFPLIEARVPVAGSVLEVGSGHGLLSLYLALTGPGRTVRGVDIDAHKIALAQQAAANLAPGEANVAFTAVTPDEFPAGRYDAIVIADVLYLLSDKARRALIEHCADALAEDGVLLIKETDHTVGWKGRITDLQERLATRVLGITAGDHVEFPEMGDLASQLRQHGLETADIPMHRGYVHPHHLVIGRRWANPLRPAAQ